MELTEKTAELLTDDYIEFIFYVAGAWDKLAPEGSTVVKLLS